MTAQAIISILSIASIILGYWPLQDLRVYGALAGLASQPFWVYMILTNHLYGILPLAPVYSALYIVAFRVHLRRAVA